MEKIDIALDADAELQLSLTEILSDLSAVHPTVAELDARIDCLKQRGEQRLQRVRATAVLTTEVARLTITNKIPAAATSKAAFKSQSKSK